MRIVNGGHLEGLPEVGLPHSSDETCESRRSERVTNQHFPKRNTGNTGGYEYVGHELKGIRYQSKTYAKLETLMNRVNETSIKGEHRKQVQRKAVGIDRVTKLEYGENLDENVADLISCMKKFSYKPKPVRRTYIPKVGSDKLRPLGIPAYEDRLVQSVMAGILNDIYEERFLDNSYGVSGNFHMVQNFYKYVKHTCFRMLNRRHQKRSMRYEKFNIIWEYYVKEPCLKVDIWNWKPKLI